MLSVSSPEITQGAAPAPSAVLSRSAPYGIALLRVALGVLLFAHGALKVFVFTLPGTAAFFASAGFPAWSAYLVAPAEVLGGLALMLIPMMAWWFDVGLWEATLMEAGLLVFFLVYTYAFNWAFDRIFGLPASAQPVRVAASGA